VLTVQYNIPAHEMARLPPLLLSLGKQQEGEHHRGLPLRRPNPSVSSSLEFDELFSMIEMTMASQGQSVENTMASQVGLLQIDTVHTCVQP